MRFEHQGLSLWYGTSDAPAPALALRFGADAWITVAVKPASASNHVEVTVRVNGGLTETVGAKWLRNDDETGAQYFRAHIPRLRAGDVVEYSPICHCAGRQVPSPEEALRFPSSFQVVGAEMRETVARLQRQLGVDTTGELDEATVAAVEGHWRGEGLTAIEVVVEEPPSVERGGGGGDRGGGSSQGGSGANEGVVHGKLVDQDGAPIPRTRVVASSQQLRTETALGQATTHGTGQYRITYRRTAPLNLVVRAYDETGAAIAQSSTVFNAAADVEVDLTTAADGVVRAPSRFTTLLAEVTDELHGTLLADLVEDKSTHEIQFVAHATGEPFNDVAHLYLADKLGKRDGLRDETLFGLFSQGIPAALDGALGSLPDTGIDDAFTGQVMNNVVIQTRDVLSGALSAALSANTIPPSYSALLDGELSKLDSLRAQSAGSAPQPIATAPTPAQQAATAGFTPVITLAGLTGAAADAVAKAVTATPVIDDAAVTNLVTSNAITAAQGKLLGFSVALYALTDESSALATAIQSASFPQLGGKPPASTAALAKLGAADWTTFLTTSNVALPAGATPQTAGVALARRFAAIEPNAALFGRLPQMTASQVTASLAPLAQGSPSEVGVPVSQFSLAELADQQRGAATAANAQLRQLSNAYPGLGLAAILDDPKTDAATKASTVTQLVGLVQQVGAQLGTTQLLRLDLSQGSTDIAKLGLDKLGAPTDQQAMVLETLKSYQRVWAVSKDIDLTLTVVGAGFTSAHAIAGLPIGTAVATLGAAGVDTATATAVWGQARATMADVGLHTGAVIHGTQGIKLGPVDNLLPSTLAYLQQLPGYQQLFGSLSFCDCEECQSIIGPAAYFVDLMTYIDANLRNQFKASGNPLDLKVRRLDLWTLELSCANTNTMVPALDIVDQVLENYIALQIQPGISVTTVTPSAPNTDRSNVEALVYKTTLAEGTSSFEQPFCLPLARVASYLRSLGSSLQAVTGAVRASADQRARAELHIANTAVSASPTEWAIITTPSVNLSALSAFYGMTFTQSGTSVNWTPPSSSTYPSVPAGAADAAVLGPAMGLSRADLGSIVAPTNFFVHAGGASVTIVGAKLSSASIQNDVEWFKGLTVDALDRMHRFTRMVGKTGWAVTDLDLVLGALMDTTLGAPGVENIAHLHALQSRFNLSIGDVCALVGLIPETPAGTSFFDQLFNAPMYVASSGPFPQPSLQFFHPSFLQGVDPATLYDPPSQSVTTVAQVIANCLPRLLLGLGVSVSDLEVLIRGLASHLAQAQGSPGGFNPDDSIPANRYFVLSADNLTLLYRHARVAKMLGVSIDNLFQLLGFLGLDFIGPPPPTPASPPSPGQPASLANLLAVIELQSWWQKSGYALDDIAVAIGQTPRNPAAYLDPGTVARQVVTAAATGLTFTSTAFSVALGVPEQGSADLLASLSTGSVFPLVQQSTFDSSWSIVPGVTFDPGSVVSMTIPPSATLTPAAVLTALGAYAAPGATFTDIAFATALGTTPQGADDLLTSLSTNASSLPKSNQPVVQQSATDGTWSVIQGVNIDSGSTVTMSVPPTTTVSPAAVLAALKAQPATFPSSALATALGTTVPGATDLLTSLSISSSPLLVKQPTPGNWSVRCDVDLGFGTAIAIPATATVATPPTPTASATTAPVTGAAVLAALQPYLPSQVLERSLGTAFNFTTDKVIAIAALAGQSLTAPAVAAVIRGDSPVTRPLPSPPPASPPPADALTTLIAALLPLTVIFASSTWNAFPATAQGPATTAPTDFVRASLTSQNAVFGTSSTQTSLAVVTLPQLRALSAYASFVQRLLAATPGPSVGTQADLQSVLSSFAGGATPPAFQAPAAVLGRVLGVPAGIVVGLEGQVMLSSTAPLALEQLDRAAQLASTLGIDGATFGALATDDYDKLSAAADALVLALGARYADPKTQASKLDAAEQPIRAAKRDALVDYLTRTPPYAQLWSTSNDLYEYFLIDVAAGGCASTSWVVSATMSAQLYVYRAIMNLEHNGLSPSDASYVNLVLPASAAQEWEWRQNYRVWQANREVFLWPENYLDPDLRDDMTPLFKDFQNQLLQTNMTDQDVADAYAAYLAGFDELASLTIAGAYHDLSDTIDVTTGLATSRVSDVLHLFGVTASDPPTYYYRSCQNFKASADGSVAPVWSPWQKISVQITARAVSPVVYEGRLHVFWVDIKSKSQNQIQGGNSNFSGYLHTMKLYFTTLRPDGTWTAPQQVQFPTTYGDPTGASIQIQDPLDVGLVASFDPLFQVETGPVDGYTLSGANWDRVWLTPTASSLQAQCRNFMDQFEIDLFRHKATPSNGVAPGPRRAMLNVANTGAWAAADNAIASYRKVVAKAQSGAFGPASQLVAIAAATSLLPLTKAATAGADTTSRVLWTWFPLPLGTSSTWSNAALANAVIDKRRLDIIGFDYPSVSTDIWWNPSNQGGYGIPIAKIPGSTGLLAVPGSEADAILQVGDDIVHLQSSASDDMVYALTRLGTTLADDVAQTLFEQGLDVLLSTGTQYQLAEAGSPITVTDSHAFDMRRLNADKLDFKGPYGVYYREIFFQAPFLIANALNAAGNFEAAQKWYQYIFDPTSSETFTVLPASKGKEFVVDWVYMSSLGMSVPWSSLVPVGDVPHALLDRVWRYREFRGQSVTTMQDILTDAKTIALYESDPFNPWAIARNRISAFQKAIVMKYVGNLLDWADSLFTQFTMESVNEALMLYIMASDILGPRPTDVGDCGAGDTPITYQQVNTSLAGSSAFEVETEVRIWGYRSSLYAAPATPSPTYTPPRTGVLYAAQRFALSGAATASATLTAAAPGNEAALAPVVAARVSAQAAATAPPAATTAVAAAPSSPAASGMFLGLGWNKATTASWGPALGNATTKTADPMGGRTFKNPGAGDFNSAHAGFGHQINTQVAAFCVPPNAQLLAYWDRVDDRLYKIRHCMDIDGNLRSLALFAPPINPMDLVAMTAAGLSLEDVLGAGNGDLPPYRFLYLIERAKAYASTLSSFGAQLLSALEKKDGEALNQLRLTQQLNLAQMILSSKQMEVDAANAAYDAVTQQLATANDRVTFYQSQLSGGLNSSESLQLTSLTSVLDINAAAAELSVLAAGLALIPNVGSPFAMTYGGNQLSWGSAHFGVSTSAMAEIANNLASVAGTTGSFDRRRDQWSFELQLANDDVQTLTKQQTAAQIRVSIATNDLATQQKVIDQTQEFLDRTQTKFTNLGLYTWLSATMQMFYRGAYQNALALANLAQQAFQFERGDYTSPGLSPPYWNATYSGLLAGEQLLRDLQTLERRFIETNYRLLEVDQPFALSQVDAGALLDLRETGQCTFTIGEAFFDLFYPGHYKRRIKAVRLTIPCITGPYVNVGATLELLASWVRTTTDLADTSQPLPMPPTRTVTIATSTAQNDAGVFELSFRDERYMPFEGLGAISQWQLTLPKTFRQFDYQTINDVIVSISYTAEQDGELRQEIEQQNARAEQAILKYYTNAASPPKRLFSLRQDFSSAFTRLLRSPTGTAVTIELSDRNFPFFLRGKGLTVKTAVLILRTGLNVSPTGFQMTVDGGAALSFQPDTSSPPLYDGLPCAPLMNFTVVDATGGKVTHSLTIATVPPRPDGLAPQLPTPGDLSAVDAAKLLDILLYVEYTLVAI